MGTRFSVGDLVTLTNTFTVDGVATDPTTVTLEVTDPSGTAVEYTFAAGEITKTATGVYTKDVTATSAGLWVYTWTGTGAAADVQDGSFRAFTASDTTLYCTIDDLKDRLTVADATDDVALQMAADAASRLIEQHCNRRFYRRTLTRKFTPVDGRLLLIPDLVSVTSLKTDDGGDGTFENTWTAGTDYVLEPSDADDDDWPYTRVRVHPSGSFRFPVGYPESVQIVGVWGWPTVPAPVVEATIVQAVKIFQVGKDGGGGFSEFTGGGGGATFHSRFQSRYLERSAELLTASFRRPVV